MATSLVIMASGFSKRMGKNKLFLDYEGKNFINRIFDVTKKYPFYERILVISPENAEKLVIPKDIKLVINTQAEKGQNITVRLGSQLATGEGILFLPIDQPLLTVSNFEEILAKAEQDNIVYPIDQNRQPRSPVYFGKKFQSKLAFVSGVGGGRLVRNKYRESCLEVAVSNAEGLIDIDTPEEYESLLKSRVRVE